MSKRKTYTSDPIDVTFDARRCIHAAQCSSNLRAVFDPKQRPWIQPQNADADAIARVVEGCPSGALRYERKDGGSAEKPPGNAITAGADGPLWVTGDIVIRDAADNDRFRDVRVALCRCGASANKPFCDNSHLDKQFKAPGVSGHPPRPERGPDEAELVLRLQNNGPIIVQTRCPLTTAGGTQTVEAGKAALCRCGGSSNKPFCDGTHKKNGFRGE